jgi:hypothetical protein
MSLCGKVECRKVVKEDDVIQCRCKRVWHIDCADGMTRSTASVIKKNNNVKWMCNDCVSMLDVIYQRMDQIWAHVVRHNELIEQQKDVLEKIEQKVEKMSKNFEESDVQ